MPSELIHVRDKATGATYPLRKHLFNPHAHEETGKSPLGRDGEPVAIKPKTTVTKAAESKSPSGQKADTTKEKS